MGNVPSVPDFQYLDFLLKWGVTSAKVSAEELITNDLIDEIDNFDSNSVVAEAKVYRFSKPGDRRDVP